MTDTLRTALDALLAAPRSVDAFGFVHYLDQQLLEAVRDAYAEVHQPAHRNAGGEHAIR